VLYDSDRRINLPAPERRVGYVPQGYSLFPHLRVEENIGFGLKQADGTGRAFSALDPAIRRALREEITALHNRTGIPTLVVTHDLSDAFDFGRRIVVLDGGASCLLPDL
jgi:ABC-type Fe3+/spermidine/putrescine transport system ATPase subunit